MAIPARPRPREAGPSAAVRAAYALVRSVSTGVTLLLVLGALTFVGTIVPQLPDAAASDPVAHAEWLTGVRQRFGAATPALDRLGAFGVFSSRLFVTVAALLALSIVAATVHRLPTLWQRAVDPVLHTGDGFYDREASATVLRAAAPPGDTAATLAAVLTNRRMRVLRRERDGHVFLYADRYRFFPLGTTLSHLGVVIVLLGVTLTTTAGFRDEERAVPVGSTVDIGHGSGLQLSVTEFTDTYNPDGSLQDAVSTVTLTDPDGVVAQRAVRVNEPLRQDGIAIHQSSFGAAARVGVTDAAGAPVFYGAIPLTWLTRDGSTQFGHVTLPGGVELYAAGPAAGRTDSGIGDGEVRVDLARRSDGVVTGTALVSPTRAAALGGWQVVLEREERYAGFLVSRDPGRPWVWAGFGLLLTGLFTTLVIGHRRLWLRLAADPGGSRLTIVAATGSVVGHRPWSDHLLTHLASVTTAPEPESRPT